MFATIGGYEQEAQNYKNTIYRQEEFASAR